MTFKKTKKVLNLVWSACLSLFLLAHFPSKLVGLDQKLAVMDSIKLEREASLDQRIAHAIIGQISHPNSEKFIYYIKNDPESEESKARTLFLLRELATKKDVKLVWGEWPRSLSKHISDSFLAVESKKPAVQSLDELLKYMKRRNISTAAVVLSEDESKITKELMRRNEDKAGKKRISYCIVKAIEYLFPPIQEMQELTKNNIQQFNRSIMRWSHIIEKAADTYSLDPDLISSLMYAESGGNPYSVSLKGAKGLMQLMDDTSERFGIKNPFDPVANILVGTRYLRELLDRFNGDEELALAAYNAGPETVKNYNGIPPYEETEKFVSKVLWYRRNMTDGVKLAVIGDIRTSTSDDTDNIFGSFVDLPDLVEFIEPASAASSAPFNSIAQEDAIQEKTIQKKTIQKDTIQQYALQENTIQQKTIQKDIIQQYTFQEDTIQEEFEEFSATRSEDESFSLDEIKSREIMSTKQKDEKDATISRWGTPISKEIIEMLQASSENLEEKYQKKKVDSVISKKEVEKQSKKAYAFLNKELESSIESSKLLNKKSEAVKLSKKNPTSDLEKTINQIKIGSHTYHTDRYEIDLLEDPSEVLEVKVYQNQKGLKAHFIDYIQKKAEAPVKTELEEGKEIIYTKINNRNFCFDIVDKPKKKKLIFKSWYDSEEKRQILKEYKAVLEAQTKKGILLVQASNL